MCKPFPHPWWRASLALLIISGGCNKAPGAPTIAITPEAPGTQDDLTASIDKEAQDPDTKDSISYAYAWYQNGTERADLTEATVPYAQTTKSETWMVEVTPHDGKVPGERGSATVTIQNSPPTAEATPSPTQPLATDDLQVEVSGSDDDGDTVTFG